MFDSLDEQIKHDEHEATTPRERVLVWLSVAVISIALFSGLYFVVRQLE